MGFGASSAATFRPANGRSMFSGGGGRPHQWQHERDESYSLLLELCSQEPTLQACFKVIESTCLARGIMMHIGGKEPSEEFRRFMN
jgi:hypothetical protein